MAKASNQWEREAAAMAARIDRAREAGEQLALFGAASDPEAEGGAGGRGKGKSLSKLRELLAARGLRQPEDVLASVAALDDPEGLVMACLKKSEAVALAFYGHAQAPAKVKLDLFQQFYAQGIRALDALLPYGLAKITPDVQVQQAVQVVMMPGAGAAAATGPATARDVTPQPRRMAPPPLPSQIEQNQQVSDAVAAASDADRRTEGPSR